MEDGCNRFSVAAHRNRMPDKLVVFEVRGASDRTISLPLYILGIRTSMDCIFNFNYFYDGLNMDDEAGLNVDVQTKGKHKQHSIGQIWRDSNQRFGLRSKLDVKFIYLI